MLVSEMSLFMLLIVPLPFTWRRTLFSFISGSPLVAKAQYGMKVDPINTCGSLWHTDVHQIAFLAVLILFIDSVNRVYRVQVELTAASESTSSGGYIPPSSNLSKSIQD